MGQLKKRNVNLSISCTSGKLNPCNQLSRPCAYGISERTMSIPKNENGLQLAAVDFGDKHTHEWGQIRISAVPTGPTAGPETSIEALDSLLRRQRWAVAHGKDNNS